MADLPGPDVLLRQSAALVGDLRSLTPVVTRRVDAALRGLSPSRVYLVGDGDSLHAGNAAELAFQRSGVACQPQPALRFAEYGAAALHLDGPGRPLVVGTSASGRTERVLRALRAAAGAGATTLAVTGAGGSPLSAAADRTVLVELPRPERSAGVRTHQASLLGLTLLALRLGGRPAEPIAAAADLLEVTLEVLAGPCAEAAGVLASSPAAVVLGGGPSHGTALFAAAKLVEAAGTLTVGQDVEEWWHVERFAYPLDMPVVLVAPPGGAHARAAEVAARARSAGRRVVAVVHEADTAVAGQALVTLPVPGDVAEELSPFVYGGFAAPLAAGVARRLGRAPFRADEPGRV
ncbi:MAG: SIS domain-containing protein [Mycobacteriales bacterium]